METRVILSVGTILLSCGCLGLLVVRLSNPFLRGLWWLGGAFASGALGAGILARRSGSVDVHSLMFTESLFLLAFVLLQVCFTDLVESRFRVPRLGLTLLMVQALAYQGFLKTAHAWKFCLISLGVLVAVQSLQSAWLLSRSAKDGTAAPVRFSMVLLILFAAYNLFRSGLIARIGVPLDHRQSNPLEVLTAIIYLGVGLGLGFGVFWMTSAQIRVALETLANTDSLTKVANRRCFTNWCERELQQSKRSGIPFSMILIDLDHFKQINDRYGHGTGDIALCAVAGKMRRCLRNIDMLGRWGGEEFVVLLPGADAGSARCVAQRLRESIEALTLSSLRLSRSGISEPLPLTVSAGVTTFIGEADTIEALLCRCDQALYEAKANGRNQVAYAAM